ncbi:hypothetical protein NNJEOMEG_02415 [Fundidesulfovibrio magnetotacticus]|uniref:Uncharacterized protein n=1 Tax=Fundidesulfovibrio magnetotacticus TaxID=2730080 RepID=A0A6V8LWB7_9BACT|nr:hypothetical protein [Fundidesulfovibrio magnetotacticus]GFK94568.1 hypothetical protein NNJEOMEG_02415 [Fundidesulfovibrio magnetotacticus]
MSQDTVSLLIHVPDLTPQAAPDVPPAVRFLDPGLAPADPPGRWFRPPDLPLDEASARALTAQFTQLARESRSVADVSAYAPSLQDAYGSTSFAIKDGLEAALEGRQDQEIRKRALARAQAELCLAWALEEVSRELDGLTAKLDGQWADFEKTLGLDEEDPLGGEEAALSGAKPDLVPAGPGLPLAVFVDAALTVLPPQCGLHASDEALASSWEEFGVAFAPADAALTAALGLAGAYRAARAPGWRLCLSRRSDPARPWLDAERTVLVPVRG